MILFETPMRIPVFLDKLSSNTRIQFDWIQAYIKKVIGHEVHQHLSVYSIPEILNKNYFPLE